MLGPQYFPALHLFFKTISFERCGCYGSLLMFTGHERQDTQDTGACILKRSDVFISSLNKKLQPLSVEPWVAGAGWGAKWELEFCV